VKVVYTVSLFDGRISMMQVFESKSLERLKGCPRCGNAKFIADPLSPFPLCEECAQCDECSGAKIVDRKICEKCHGRGYILKNVKVWGPSKGGGHDYDEESDDFFTEVEEGDDIEMISLDDLADDEFAEFEDGEEGLDLY